MGLFNKGSFDMFPQTKNIPYVSLVDLKNLHTFQKVLSNRGAVLNIILFCVNK